MKQSQFLIIFLEERSCGPAFKTRILNSPSEVFQTGKWENEAAIKENSHHTTTKFRANLIFDQ
jgi:hypothetical protein